MKISANSDRHFLRFHIWLGFELRERSLGVYVPYPLYVPSCRDIHGALNVFLKSRASFVSGVSRVFFDGIPRDRHLFIFFVKLQSQ